MQGISAPVRNLAKLRGLTKFTGEELVNGSKDIIWSLKNVSFEVNKGDVLGIVGNNGAGKSTLLKILSRVTDPTGGYVEINGRLSCLLEVGTGFHPELTGRENIFLSGAVLGMSKQEIKNKFDEIVNFAEIEKFIDTPVKRYSSGMYVRLAFAVAVHLEPDILIIDEVLAVGDIAFQKKCLRKIESFARKGQTILFVSHNTDMVKSLCDNALWLKDGHLVKTGSVNEVIRDYEEQHINFLNISSSIIERNPLDYKELNFYISRVEILNIKNEHTTIFRYNEKIILLVDIGGEPLSNKYSIEFRIYNETGDFVALGSSGLFHGIFFEKKIKKVRIEIGPLTLTKGKYAISLSAMGMLGGDTWDNACLFQIVECYPFSTHFDIDNRSICVLQQSFNAMR
jgi:lipopolysaccharide transport system ATP-binding protein